MEDGVPECKSILKLIRVGFPDKYGILMKKRNIGFQNFWPKQKERRSCHLLTQNGREIGFERKIRIFKHAKPKMPRKYQVEIVKWQVDI